MFLEKHQACGGEATRLRYIGNFITGCQHQLQNLLCLRKVAWTSQWQFHKRKEYFVKLEQNDMIDNHNQLCNYLSNTFKFLSNFANIKCRNQWGRINSLNCMKGKEWIVRGLSRPLFVKLMPNSLSLSVAMWIVIPLLEVVMEN